jgi:hypothetical protein
VCSLAITRPVRGIIILTNLLFHQRLHWSQFVDIAVRVGNGPAFVVEDFPKSSIPASSNGSSARSSMSMNLSGIPL